MTAWQNFYVIVGSSAGALIGLQFVVMTLIAQLPLPSGAAQAGNAYTTPTVVHFGAVLLLSAIACVPWNGPVAPAILWVIVGLSGSAYIVLVAKRQRTQTAYEPVFEDQLFHVLLPFAAYAALGLSACTACFHTSSALYLVGAVCLLLLFIGIHNSWDTVTYHVFVKRPESKND